MKLITALNARAGLELARRIKLKDGLRAFKLHKEIEKIKAEYDSFNKFQDETIKATGKTELRKGDPDIPEVERILNEAANSTDIADPTPYIEELDLTGTEASAEEIDGIIALKLLKEPSEPPALPGPMIAK